MMTTQTPSIPIFLLTPGSHGLKALESLISGQPIAGITDIWSLLGNLTAIGIGIFIGRFIWFQSTLHRSRDIIHRHAAHAHIHIPRYHYKSKDTHEKRRLKRINMNDVLDTKYRQLERERIIS